MLKKSSQAKLEACREENDELLLQLAQTGGVGGHRAAAASSMNRDLQGNKPDEEFNICRAVIEPLACTAPPAGGLGNPGKDCSDSSSSSEKTVEEIILALQPNCKATCDLTSDRLFTQIMGLKRGDKPNTDTLAEVNNDDLDGLIATFKDMEVVSEKTKNW
jgi:hypothetical protein